MSSDEGFEFRVVWQREGLSKRVKIYQTRKGAERFVRTLRGEYGFHDRDYGPFDRPPSSYWADIPDLIFGPIIECREIGQWQPTTPTEGENQ